MSLFGKILGGIGKIARFIPGPIGTVARVATGVGAALGRGGGGRIITPGIGGKITPAFSAGLPAIRGGTSVARRVLPGLGAIGAAGAGGRILRGLGTAGGIAAGADVLFDAFGRPKKKRRTMNPCNAKALRRALRRIEGYERLNKRVEKSLRKACPPRRSRSTPSRRKC